MTSEPQFTALCKFHIAIEQRKAAEGTGDRNLLGKAKQNATEVLAIWTREQALAWAWAQFELGNVLVREGEINGDATLTRKAIEKFKYALAEQRPSRVLVDWANSKVSLGSAYASVAESQTGPGAIWNIFESISCFEKVLKKLPKQDAPSIWALANNNLAGSFLHLHQRLINGNRSFILRAMVKFLYGNLDEKAVSSLIASLTVFKTDYLPRDWAMAKLNLAAAYLMLGKRTKDRNLLRAAAGSAADAMTIYSKSRFPKAWALCRCNRAGALMALNELEPDRDLVSDAVECYRSAIDVFHKNKDASQLASIESNLHKATSILNKFRTSAA